MTKQEAASAAARLISSFRRGRQPHLQRSRHTSERAQGLHALSVLSGYVWHTSTNSQDLGHARYVTFAYFSASAAHLCVGNDFVVSHIHHSLVCGLRPWESTLRQLPDLLTDGCRQCNYSTYNMTTAHSLTQP